MLFDIRVASIVAFLFVALISSDSMPISAEEPRLPSLNLHLQGGEFVIAKQMAQRELPSRRDNLLAQVAASQSDVGESVASAGTVRQIESPSSRESAMAGGRGGNSFADFDSLIELIQTTVVPDTWEALGGPSTMSEYPQGIYVDSRGTVHECASSIELNQADNLRAILSKDFDQRVAVDHDPAGGHFATIDWRAQAELRFVSLKRLRDQIASHRIQGTNVPTEIRFLAGLSSVKYVVLTDDDVVLAGPIGGVETVQGWYRDVTTKRLPLRADFLFTTLASAMSARPFGCTIDPTTEGLQRAAQLAIDVKRGHIPIGQAAERLKQALGVQRVEVFGTAADTPIGYLMVEADRHMKQLALGTQPMPNPAKNYLDMVDAMIDQGAPDELLLRLWFTSAACDVRCDQTNRVFELSGTPIRLSGENERALASGQRGHGATDIRTQAFVKNFNQHWGSIRQTYPIYGSLESVYHCASIAELLRRYAPTNLKEGLLASLATEASLTDQIMPAPRQVESIATMHTVRHGRTRHHLLLASGGVAVDPKQTVAATIERYPSLASAADIKQHEPKLIQRWWWNTGGER